MAEMGWGYGSECHLLRYLGRHRRRLDTQVKLLVDAETIEWCDFKFDRSKTWLDAELAGLSFLEADQPAKKRWANIWPQRGTQPTWDAVARIRRHGVEEWLLVEAKGNVEELNSSCGASKEGGLAQIVLALAAAKKPLGVSEERDWLREYYQYSNRITVLEFLSRKDVNVPARLLFIYFVGDSVPRRTCPTTAEGWGPSLDNLKKHVGLPELHPLAGRVHELFLDVCPPA